MLNINLQPFPRLISEKLVLRQINSGDKHELFFLRSDSDVLKYLDKHPSPSIEETLAYIERISKLQEDNEAILWGITLNDNPKIIGTICFWRIEKAHFRAEIGYVLHPEFQRQGIMQEAISSVLNYGFNTMKLHSVEAKVNPSNQRSIRLLEKNNFVREGFFKEDYFFDGRFLDTGVYSLLTPVR